MNKIILAANVGPFLGKPFIEKYSCTFVLTLEVIILHLKWFFSNLFT